jgi:hypothetical protein
VSEFPQSPDPETTENKGTAQQVADTTKEQARYAAQTSKKHVQEAARHMGGQVRGEADSQTRRLAHGVRTFADDLSSMSADAETGSVARGLVQQLADGGRQVADWLDDRGLDGLLTEMRSFARRRPGMFLLGAGVTGFVVGRVAKATSGSDLDPDRNPSHSAPSEPGADRDADSPSSQGPYEPSPAMTAEPGAAPWSHPTGSEVP